MGVIWRQPRTELKECVYNYLLFKIRMSIEQKIPTEAFSEILAELQKKPIPRNEYRNTAGKGRSQVFGVVGRRCLPPDYSRLCWLRPYLFKLLLDFADKYVDIPWNAITVNQNYRSSPHYDKHNIGDSLLVAFGNYSGGELELHEGEKKGVYDINCKPIVHNFSTTLHSVREFEGERYSLVFYMYENPCWSVDVPPPSVVFENGKWWFKRGEEICTGLPHPITGQKKVRKNRKSE